MLSEFRWALIQGLTRLRKTIFLYTILYNCSLFDFPLLPKYRQQLWANDFLKVFTQRPPESDSKSRTRNHNVIVRARHPFTYNLFLWTTQSYMLLLIELPNRQRIINQWWIIVSGFNRPLRFLWLADKHWTAATSSNCPTPSNIVIQAPSNAFLSSLHSSGSIVLVISNFCRVNIQGRIQEFESFNFQRASFKIECGHI